MDPGVFSRGRTLMERERVEVKGGSSRGLEGQVRGRGSVRHPVRLTGDAGGLEAECTCAHYGQEGFCEHLVALGLVWLKVNAPEEFATSAALSRPQTPEGIRQWLEAREIAYLARVPLLEVESFLPRERSPADGFSRLAHLPLVSAIDGTLTFASGDLRALQEPLVRATWARLDAEVERVHEGKAYEQRHPEPPPPTDARLVPLGEALRRLREAVRAHAVPRKLPPSVLRLTLAEEPPVFHAHEPLVHFAKRTVLDDALHQQCVRVEVPRILGGEEAVFCSRCAPATFARCVHALTALDAVLGRLGDAAHAEDNARLAERLFVEPGRKLLAALEI